MRNLRAMLFEFVWSRSAGPVFVLVWPQTTGVELPPRVKAALETVVMLRLEPSVAGDSQGLEIGEDALRALMSFERAPFHVVVPWEAVVAIEVPGVLTIGFSDVPPPEPQKPGLRLVK